MLTLWTIQLIGRILFLILVITSTTITGMVMQYRDFQHWIPCVASMGLEIRMTQRTGVEIWKKTVCLWVEQSIIQKNQTLTLSTIRIGCKIAVLNHLCSDIRWCWEPPNLTTQLRKTIHHKVYHKLLPLKAWFLILYMTSYSTHSAETIMWLVSQTSTMKVANVKTLLHIS